MSTTIPTNVTRINPEYPGQPFDGADEVPAQTVRRGSRRLTKGQKAARWTMAAMAAVPVAGALGAGTYVGGKAAVGAVERMARDSRTPNILNKPHRVTTAGSNDTVWSIAERATPEGQDIRPVVDEVVQALGTTAIQPGEAVPVPEDSRIGQQVGPDSKN